MEEKRKKVKYEAPRMMPLGNLSTGFGGCNPGSTAQEGNCSGGGFVGIGSNPGNTCNTGPYVT